MLAVLHVALTIDTTDKSHRTILNFSVSKNIAVSKTSNWHIKQTHCNVRAGVGVGLRPGFGFGLGLGLGL